MNITQLKQGSLNGLRKQTNECLDNAYNKGFEDGKKWAIDENAKDHQGYFDNGYNNAIEDLSHAIKMYFPLNSKERLDYFGTNIQTERYAIEFPKDLIAMAKAYEEKKKSEETIKVGDIVYYGDEMLKAVVLDIATEQGVTYAVMLDENGLNVNEELSGLKFIEHTNEVEQLLNRLKGE